jgi:hypothetical protein
MASDLRVRPQVRAGAPNIGARLRKADRFDEATGPQITRSVAEEAAELVRVLNLEAMVDVLTSNAKCRVHLAKGDMLGKECNRCHNKLTRSSFYRNQRTTDGLQGHCMQCDLTRKEPIAKAVRKARGEPEPERKSDKITRKQWPNDKAKRLSALKRLLPLALADYDGQEAAISVHLNIDIDEIREAIEGSKELQRLFRHAKMVAISKVEANAYKLATESNNATSVKFWLINNSDNWSDKSSLDVRSVGFSVPDEDQEPAAVLKIVNRHVED